MSFFNDEERLKAALCSCVGVLHKYRLITARKRSVLVEGIKAEDERAYKEVSRLLKKLAKV